MSEQSERASNLKSDGGYCPMCDTVWASPGKCRCEPIKSLEHFNYVYDNVEEVKLPTFDVEIWNAAIEAAAKEAINVRLVGVHFVAEQIRKLKK